MKTAVVICPGRGTYNKTELGWLKRHFADAVLLSEFDRRRTTEGRTPITELDAAVSLAPVVASQTLYILDDSGKISAYR